MQITHNIKPKHQLHIKVEGLDASGGKVVEYITVRKPQWYDWILKAFDCLTGAGRRKIKRLRVNLP